jgi:hypothetical protein
MRVEMGKTFKKFCISSINWEEKKFIILKIIWGQNFF